MSAHSFRHTALAGKPNSGKSSIFNALTGLHQKVGNFTGVTVDKAVGKIQIPGVGLFPITDLPGTYSLFPKSEDERVTTHILTHPEAEDFPDQVLVVAEASNLRNSLLLCTQIMDLGFPTALVVNMIDLLPEKGLTIDFQKLETVLGIPVWPVSVRKKTGFDALRKGIANGFPIPLRTFYTPNSEEVSQQEAYIAFLAASEQMAQLPAPELDRYEARMIQDTLNRYHAIDAILEDCTQSKAQNNSPRPGADAWLMHPVMGYLFFFLMLALMFQAVFAWAEWPMGQIEDGIAMAGSLIESILPAGMLTDMLVNGLIAGIGGVLVFIPQIAFLFLFIAVLEESGYMARVVYLMDRIMRNFGMNGRSIIPLIGGMACAIPSIMSARGIPDRRERLITIMVTPLMSCSARIPVYTLIIGLVIPEYYIAGWIDIRGLVMLGLYLAGFFMALLAAYLLKGRVAQGEGYHFLVELPLYRMPSFRNLSLTVWHKCKAFVWEAGRIILMISIVLWFLVSYGPSTDREEIDNRYARYTESGHFNSDTLAVQKQAELLEVSYAGIMGKWIEPVIRPLGFDWKIGIGLIASFAAREVFVGTMATIYASGGGEEDESSIRERMRFEVFQDTGQPVYTLATGVALLVFYAFAMQCMSTLAITKRETGNWKWPAIMLGYLTLLAYVAAWLVQQVLS